MRIRIGDFFPRVEWGWFPEPTRRCHKLGAHTVELQGGLGVAAVAARNRDAEGVREGLSRVEHAAEELAKGLPEAKEFTSVLRNRAKALGALAEPYRYRMPLPKRTAKAVEEQVRGLGDYEFRVEELSIKACGGHPTGAHALYKETPGPLPKIPQDVVRDAKRRKAELEREAAARMKRTHREVMKSIRRIRRKKAGLKPGQGLVKAPLRAD